MTCPKCGQPSNKRYSSKEATYILNNHDYWSWWFDFGSTEYGFYTIDHIPGNYPSLEIGSCFRDKDEGHERLAEMTEEEGWEFIKGGDKFSAAYGALEGAEGRSQKSEVGGQESEARVLDRGQDVGGGIKYYALLDTEGIVALGECEDIGEAFEKEPQNAHWLFSENGLRDMLNKIQEVLDKENKK